MKRCFIYLIALCTGILSLTYISCDDEGGLLCKTKHPIVMVHGIAFKDSNMLGIRYFWGIIDDLEENGAEVYVTNQRAWGSNEARARDLADELCVQFAENPGWEKINIIAHSQGALDARYLITHLDIPGKGPAHKYVASLTSIGGVHHGSEIADVLWALHEGIPILGVMGDIVAAGVDAFSSIFYYDEDDQDCMEAMYNLTSEYMDEKFNPNTPDMPDVFYQSWAGKIQRATPECLISGPLNALMLALGAGGNDAFVSVESAKWGHFRGVVPYEGKSGVSHFNLINHFLGNTSNGFDAPQFYVDIVSELKQYGF